MSTAETTTTTELEFPTSTINPMDDLFGDMFGSDTEEVTDGKFDDTQPVLDSLSPIELNGSATVEMTQPADEVTAATDVSGEGEAKAEIGNVTFVAGNESGQKIIDAARAESDRLEQVREAEEHVSDLMLRAKEIDAQKKMIKEEIKEAVNEVERLRKHRPEKKSLSEQIQPTIVLAHGKEMADKAIEVLKGGSPFPANVNDSWRICAHNRTSIIQHQRFRREKTRSLNRPDPTIGDLEDARAKAGINGFNTVLPKGIGVGAASEIENAMLDWLAKNRDSAVLAPINLFNLNQLT